MTKTINALLVLDKLAELNKDVYAFPLSTNLKSAKMGKDNWGEITVAVPNQLIYNINNYVGSLYLANAKEYEDMCVKEYEDSTGEGE